MAPSPRKRAIAATTTWPQTDATSFDPAALPVARLPRAWERKPQTIMRDGKEKKVWRTYATRSSLTTTSAKDEEPETQRAVKRQQRIRPAEMENMAGTPRSKKRAFKGTRFERRKSVLPRKKLLTRHSTGTSLDDLLAEPMTETARDAESEGDDSVEEIEGKEDVSEVLSAIGGNRRPSPFTFTAEEVHSKVDQPEAMDTAPVQTATPTKASPRKAAPSRRSSQRLSLKYQEVTRAQEETEEVALSTVVSIPSDAMEMQQTTASADDTSTEQEQPEDANTEESMIDFHFAPEGDSIDVEKDTLGEAPEEDFTEASLQLALLEELPALLDSEDVFESIEAHVPSVEGEHEQDCHREMSQLSVEDAMDIDEQSAEDTASETSEKAESPPCPEEDENDDMEVPTDSEVPTANSSSHPLDDIAIGLTLTPSLSAPARKYVSPPPPPSEPGMDEATTTVFFDDDTAILKDFLNRAAASKASKTATIARRSSLQNRRDSGAIRQALASPRKVLEEKDPNSPSKYDDMTLDMTVDLSQTLTLEAPLPASPTPGQADADLDFPEQEEIAEAEDSKATDDSTASSRRSTRTRKSRLPAPPPSLSNLKTPKNISVRGAEPIVLKKTEAQALGLLTRTNTRKNKQGAMNVQLRLLRLNTIEKASTGSEDSTTTADTAPQPGSGKRNIRWDETLAYYQEDTRSIENALAEAQSLETPDELSTAPSTTATVVKQKAPVPKQKAPVQKASEASRIRRVRGLGAANGTPGKGLLTPASLLPDGVVADGEKEKEKGVKVTEKPKLPTAAEERKSETLRLPKPKASKLKKMIVVPGTTSSSPAVTGSKSKLLAPLPLTTQDMMLTAPVSAPAPVAAAAPTLTKERKSRLATPRKVKLPGLPVPSSSSAVMASESGKENKAAGIVGGTPKKGIRLPEVVVPTVPAVPVVQMESGLPRRRMGRRV